MTVCCCSLAGTKACTYCTNNPYAEPERRYVLNVASTQPCIFKYEKPKTNADRIRGMTDEELAAILQQTSDCPCPGKKLCEDAGADALSCEKVLLKWLKQEAT